MNDIIQTAAAFADAFQHAYGETAHAHDSADASAHTITGLRFPAAYAGATLFAGRVGPGPGHHFYGYLANDPDGGLHLYVTGLTHELRPAVAAAIVELIPEPITGPYGAFGGSDYVHERAGYIAYGYVITRPDRSDLDINPTIIRLRELSRAGDGDAQTRLARLAHEIERSEQYVSAHPAR